MNCNPNPPTSCDDADEANTPAGCVKVNLKDGDLELIKSYNGSKTTFAVGDTLTYDIVVTNK